MRIMFNDTITVEEAARISGFAPFTIREKARVGECFVASKPRGDRAGWQINRLSFLEWMKRNYFAKGNKAAKELARKALRK